MNVNIKATTAPLSAVFIWFLYDFICYLKKVILYDYVPCTFFMLQYSIYCRPKVPYLIQKRANVVEANERPRCFQ